MALHVLYAGFVIWKGAMPPKQTHSPPAKISWSNFAFPMVWFWQLATKVQQFLSLNCVSNLILEIW